MYRNVLRCFVPAVLLAGIAVAQVAGTQKSSPGEKLKNKDKVEEFVWPELTVLDKFAGPWEVSESHYNSRGEVIGSARGIEEGAWALDRRVLRRTYTTGEEPKLYRAVGMITWDAAEKVYKGAWFDNATTSGPTSLTGVWDESARTMTFTLNSNSTEGKPVQHKVVDRFLDDEHRIVTTYKTIGNQVEKVIEVQFTRARPCPGGVGIIPESSGKP